MDEKKMDETFHRTNQIRWFSGFGWTHGWRNYITNNKKKAQLLRFLKESCDQ